MKKIPIVRTMALLGVFALAAPAFAKPVMKTMNIYKTAHLGQRELLAGAYRLKIDGTTVIVEKNGKVAAEAQGRWEVRDAKSPYSSVLLDADGRIKEVRFEGEKRVLVISE
jgi:hypothetical protein